jgi:hypothetical protein
MKITQKKNGGLVIHLSSQEKDDIIRGKSVTEYIPAMELGIKVRRPAERWEHLSRIRNNISVNKGISHKEAIRLSQETGYTWYNFIPYIKNFKKSPYIATNPSGPRDKTRQIIEKLHAKVPVKKIAVEFGLTTSRIYQIREKYIKP